MLYICLTWCTSICKKHHWKYDTLNDMCSLYLPYDYILLHTYDYICTYIYYSLSICTYMYWYTPLYIYTYPDLCIYIYIYISIYIYMYVCIKYVYICTIQLFMNTQFIDRPVDRASPPGHSHRAGAGAWGPGHKHWPQLQDHRPGAPPIVGRFHSHRGTQ